MQEIQIEDHGVIGNMQSAALINIRGDIDFFCFPDFDSPSVFAALLDPAKGGRFQVEPQMRSMRVKQLYLPETNILITRFLSEEGALEITDLMGIPKADRCANRLVRNLRVMRGKIKIRLRCSPRFDYARIAHSTRKEKDGVKFTPQSGELKPMSLLATVPLMIENGDAIAEFTLEAEKTATFMFGNATEDDDRPAQKLDEKSFDELLGETSRFWRDWTAQSKYKGRWREMVNRSALILKLLSHHEHGSLLASPTFSLPERQGGARNWDYRFTWLRDASFTLYAFMRLGFDQEPRLYSNFLYKRMNEGLARKYKNGPLKPMYRIDGSSNFKEARLEHFSGYAGSKPVRIGNAAESQLQLDVYGELMDAIYLATKYGNTLSYDGWKTVCGLLDWLQNNWQRPDQGIWEMRKQEQHFLHSRLMCWVAFDRASRLALKRSLSAPLGPWLKTRDAIYEDIHKHFWNARLNSFVQTKGSQALDASVLLMPLMRFISPTDPRWTSTMAAIENNLTEDGLVYRYQKGSDGLEGREGTFTPCSFWLIECVARTGQIERARLMFEKILSYANHLGLYSEEIGLSGEQLGNFPQALTHLALISAASYLDRKLSHSRDEPWQ